MTATQEFDVATLNHTYILPGPAEVPPVPDSARPGEGAAELARAMEDYKLENGRPFPTWSEVLEVIRGLGYAKRPEFGSPGRHRVRINRTGPTAERIRAILARLGGVPLPPPPDGQYGFPCEPDRERALDLVRADQGWTSIEPR
jgi:hypothetical protein